MPWKEDERRRKRERQDSRRGALPRVCSSRVPRPKASYTAAVARFRDVVLMEKTPDRVPVFPFGTFMVPQLYGVTPYEAMYDTDKMLSAQLSYLKDYKPDYYARPPSSAAAKCSTFSTTNSTSCPATASRRSPSTSTWKVNICLRMSTPPLSMTPRISG